jgi:hypothetical protein
LTAEQLTAFADVGDRYSRVRPHHDAPEHPASLREDARCGARDAAPGRGGAHDAGSLRELGAQHHGLPRTRVSRPTRCSTSRRIPRR